MPFMKPEFWHSDAIYEVDLRDGCETFDDHTSDIIGSSDLTLDDDVYVIDARIREAFGTGLMGDTVDEKRESIGGPKSGWMARLSAPGYLDATDPVGPKETAQAAISSLSDLYRNDDEESNDEDEQVMWDDIQAQARSEDQRFAESQK